MTDTDPRPWVHPAECSNVHDEGGNCIEESSGYIVGWPERLDAITGRDIHREWRDGMLAQGRAVAPERMAWDTLDQQDRDLDDGIAARLAALSAPSPEAERLLPTFEVGQVVGDLQPGRRRHDWCSAHGDIGPAESITAHAIAAHGSTPEQIRKARKVIARAAAPEGDKP